MKGIVIASDWGNATVVNTATELTSFVKDNHITVVLEMGSRRLITGLSPADLAEQLIPMIDGPEEALSANSLGPAEVAKINAEADYNQIWLDVMAFRGEVLRLKEIAKGRGNSPVPGTVQPGPPQAGSHQAGGATPTPVAAENPPDELKAPAS